MSDDTDFLVHYGTPRHSGRYPWGSGEQPQQSGRDLLGMIDQMRKSGLSDAEIAKGLGLKSTTELRAQQSIAKTRKRQADAAQALKLKDKGMSVSAIARAMGRNESSVRAMLDPAIAARRDSLEATANLLRSKVGPDRYLDISKGVESQLGISSTKLATAAAILRSEGYVVRNVQAPQLGTSSGKMTTVKVLAPEGTSYVDIKTHMERIGSVQTYSNNRGQDYEPIRDPVSVSSKRIGIRWAEDGGGKADGIIYVRPGVRDVSLGGSRYLQVRIAVDGTHYLKGMAMYKDGLPDGVDLQFNTSKSRSSNKLDAMKPLHVEGERPFKSVTRQMTYTDASGKKHQSPMNIVYEQGDWRDWSRSISSQILSKQPTTLAKRQLDLALALKRSEFDEIRALTNPVVKGKLLQAFADGADSAAVHLKGAPFRRQGTHVILPLEGMKEDQIYAPNYRNGERVALFRHPHGGTFEIPELTVNNRVPEGRKLIGTHAPDAVGIHPNVAKRLSGADFDGDTVLVVPNPRHELRISSPLKELEGFDPHAAYPKYPGMAVMTERAKQQHMGVVTNLITDMTIKGARPDEIARAIKHSMVVIDAVKHELDYKRSYEENGIAALKRRYQGVSVTKTGSTRLSGASTLISRAKARVQIPQQVPRPARRGGPIDPSTGERVYERTGATRLNSKGQPVEVKQWARRMAVTKDARSLSSGTAMEEIYASHANALKSLANEARRELVRTGGIKYSPAAAKTYAPEVGKLIADLNIAYMNRPKERQAQIIANITSDAKIRDSNIRDEETRKKIRIQELKIARDRLGAKKSDVEIQISDRQWQAIQAGAVSTHRLNEILDNANLDRVKKLATPRKATVMSPARVAIARNMLAAGYTQAEVSQRLGIPASTIMSALYPKSEGG